MEGLASLSISEVEDGGWNIAKLGNAQLEDFKLCLVGCFLIEAIIKFDFMKNTLVDIWRPIAGVSIQKWGSSRYLFRFFYEVDIKRVIDGGPWTLNNYLLLIHQLQHEEHPSRVDIYLSHF